MTILLTKVRPPQRRKDVLRRVRLIDSLHQNLHRKLTFVSAPAGYGKTTLLVDFSADVDAIVCWYRIGPEDNDLVQFARHLLAAFQQQIENFGPQLEETLASPGGTRDAASLAIDFINEVEQKVGDFCLLVLDDYHLAGENQQIVDFIENFLEHLPDHLRILIGSRSVYGIPTASLYIREELVTISADELRFRADELQRLVLQNHRIRLSDEQAQEFAKRADGWIIAILLALRTMENGILPRFSGGIEQVYKYLAEEVVNRQSEELREFMLATSILGDFNEALCNFLLEHKDTSSFLRALEERNLFVSRTDTLDGPSYRYHQLFSDFLRDYFKRTDAPHLQALHLRAAEWHYGRKEWEQAIEHKLAGGDKHEAADWMDSVAAQFYTSGRQMLLDRWVKSLQKAPDLRKEAPHLLLYQAKLLGTQGQFPASLKLLTLAEPALTKLGDIDAIANALITRGMISRFTGKYGEALRLAGKAQDLLKGKDKPELRQKWLQAERLRAIPLFYMGKPREAVSALEEAAAGLRDLAAEGEPSLRVLYQYDLAECLNDLGFLQIALGRMLDAQKAFQETLEIHLGIHSNLGALATARNNIGYLHHQVGQYAQAWHEYSLALDHARSSNQARWQIGILNGRAELLLDVDEKEEAYANLQQALILGQQTGEKPGMIATYMGLARTERQREHYQEAMNWLRKAASFSGGGLDEAEYKVELGRIYADMGQPNLALEQFEATLQEWPSENSPTQSQVLAAYLAARTNFLSGKEQAAIDLLNQALQGAARLGYDQFLVAASRTCLDFLNHFAANSSPQLRTLIARASKFVTGKAALETKQVEVEIRPINMEVRAFGNGEIRKDGELLPSSAWRSSRARALFFYILDKYKVRKEVIGLEFWPDFSSGKISSNFHATLWRVRQALGFKEAIVFENDQYSLHPSFQIWYDVAEFESNLAKAKDTTLSDRERAERIKQAIGLYQQSYLQDIYLEWADRRREELRNQYLDALIDLAGLETNSKRYREAKSLYDKILEVDPYRDEVHLALMNNLATSGAPSAAVAHFKSYRSLLRKELNAEPLPELQAYYEKLLAKATSD